jgi:hypothetical protein
MGKTAFIIPHTPEVYPLIGGTFPIHDIGVILPNVGGNELKEIHPNHFWSYRISYSSLTRPEYLGFKISYFADMNMYLGSYKQLRFYHSLSTGPTLIQKPFNLVSNPQNQVIGSNINLSFDSKISVLFPVAYDLNAQLSFGMEHYSNGAIIRPNKGLNIPYLGITLSYSKEDSILSPKLQKIEVYPNRWLISASMGSKTLDTDNPDRYFVYQIQMGRKFFFKKKRNVTVGLDLFYDRSTPYLNLSEEQWDPSFWLIGLYGEYAKQFGNFEINFGSGAYLFSPYSSWNQKAELVNKGSRIYNRIGFRRYFNKIYGLIQIKAHMGDADHVEFGIGYKW